MKSKSKLKNMPFPLLATMVGLATLSNVWLLSGYTWIRHISMWAGFIVLFCYIGKMILHFDIVKKEYSNVVPASLYAGFSMLIMILGSYVFSYSPVIGKTMWALGLALHTIHLSYFIYKNVIKSFNIDTFVPSWFVTFAGIMVSTVIGGPMNEPLIGKLVVLYGFIPAFIILPLMVIRLIKKPIKTGPLFMTKPILAAPSSLFLVSYLNVFKNPIPIIVYIIYVVILLTLIYILINLPKFFAFEFHPGFAGLTFPLAIACVASSKMAGFLMTQGQEDLSAIVTQIFGVQVYLTTAIIGVVIFNFMMLFINSLKKK